MHTLAEAYVISLPVIVKATPGDHHRRLVEVEASNEVVDREGDVVLQKALLDAAPEFLRIGQLDIDHLSEIGDRIGIAKPLDWVVGVPREVKDLGGGRTSVVGELHKHVEGLSTKADDLWKSLTRDPPDRWQASIFGWPTGRDSFFDARKGRCPEAPDATRFVIRSLDWKSLAFTKSPVNAALRESAHVMTMKAFLQSVAKGPDMTEPMGAGPMAQLFPAPRNRLELLGHYTHHIERGRCPVSGTADVLGKSVASFRDHFMCCCCCMQDEADLLALALMHLLHRGGA
jgi:hypothetical protein